MIILLLSLLFGDVAPQDSPIWQQLRGVESHLTESVNQDYESFAVFRSDPVRGYYIQGVGAVVLVPVRYRVTSENIRSESMSAFASGTDRPVLDRHSLEKRMNEIQESMRKQRLVKEADFQKVVGKIESQVGAMVVALKALPDNESLTIIVEEREPAWSRAGLSLTSNDKRMVLTMTAGPTIIRELRQGREEVLADMSRRLHLIDIARAKPVIP